MTIEELSQEECLDVLARATVGRLGCCYQNQPYVVPIQFAYHKECLYGFTTRGQKIDWMRYNPLVCVEIDQVKDIENWISVIANGHFEELAETHDWNHESLRTLDLLNRRAGWWRPGCASSAHRNPVEPLTPIFYRIRIDSVTGRRAASSPGEEPPEIVRGSAHAGVNWLKKLLRAIG